MIKINVNRLSDTDLPPFGTFLRELGKNDILVGVFLFVLFAASLYEKRVRGHTTSRFCVCSFASRHFPSVLKIIQKNYVNIKKIHTFFLFTTNTQCTSNKQIRIYSNSYIRLKQVRKRNTWTAEKLLQLTSA